MNRDDVNRVWNRAAADSAGDDARTGDRALASVLRADGLVMNGGVHHAVDVMSQAELSGAAAGFRFFRFADVASLLEAVAQGQDPSEARANQRYATSIPEDAVLTRRFKETLLASPDLFAPLFD
jgi:hypothetical protein